MSSHPSLVTSPHVMPTCFCGNISGHMLAICFDLVVVVSVYLLLSFSLTLSYTNINTTNRRKKDKGRWRDCHNSVLLDQNVIKIKIPSLSTTAFALFFVSNFSLVHKILKTNVLCKCEHIIPLDEDIHSHQRMSHFHLDTPVHVLNTEWGGLFIPVQAAHPVHTQISVFWSHWLADCPHEWMVSFKHIFGLMVLIVMVAITSKFLHRETLFLMAWILYRYFLLVSPSG